MDYEQKCDVSRVLGGMEGKFLGGVQIRIDKDGAHKLIVPDYLSNLGILPGDLAPKEPELDYRSAFFNLRSTKSPVPYMRMPYSPMPLSTVA